MQTNINKYICYKKLSEDLKDYLTKYFRNPITSAADNNMINGMKKNQQTDMKSHSVTKIAIL